MPVIRLNISGSISGWDLMKTYPYILLVCLFVLAVGSQELSANEKNPFKEESATEKTVRQGQAVQEELPDNFLREGREAPTLEFNEADDNIGTLALHLFFYVALVIVLIFVFVTILRKLRPSSVVFSGNPGVTVIGRTPLWGKNSLFLVKVGSGRVLLLNATVDEVSVITEITDPGEISELITVSSGKRENSFFDKVLHKSRMFYEGGDEKNEHEKLKKMDSEMKRMQEKMERLRQSENR